jgi:predicted enzyme related to lactoylglutathione lyase
MTALLVNIDVDDLARAEAFYCAAFGVTPARRFGADAVELVGLATPIYLLLKPAGSLATKAATARRDYTRHWSPVHLDLVVDDLAAAIARVTAAGAIAEGDVHTYRWGRIAHFADPFGHGFCLLQFLNRGYDEIATRAK